MVGSSKFICRYLSVGGFALPFSMKANRLIVITQLKEHFKIDTTNCLPWRDA